MASTSVQESVSLGRSHPWMVTACPGVRGIFMGDFILAGAGPALKYIHGAQNSPLCRTRRSTLTRCLERFPSDRWRSWQCLSVRMRSV